MKTICKTINQLQKTALSFCVFALIGTIMYSCQKEYMEEPTEEGVNNHSFIMNGEKWARQGYIYLPASFPPPTAYDDGANLLKFRLFSYNTPDDDKTSKLYMDVYLDWDGITLPYSCTLEDYEYSYNQDTTRNYLMLTYRSEENPTMITFDEVLSANLIITRFDTIVAGTFNAVVSNGTDTFELLDGKFDYQCKNNDLYGIANIHSTVLILGKLLHLENQFHVKDKALDTRESIRKGQLKKIESFTEIMDNAKNYVYQ